MNKTRARDLFRKRIKKEITHDQYQRECLVWLFELWADFRPKYFFKKPYEVINHEQIPYEERKELKEGYFRKIPEILKYYDRRDIIFESNNQTIQDLDNFKEYCETKEELERLKQKMSEFEPIVKQQREELASYRQSIGTEEKEQVQKVADMFGGNITR